MSVPPLISNSSAGTQRSEAAASLIEAARTSERAGHRAQSRDEFESALRCLRGPDSAPQAAAVLRWIARSYMTDADLDAATDCAEASLAVAQACGDRAAEGHAVNVLAAIDWGRGDLDAAERLFGIARACGLASGERALVAMTSHNLGIIANIRGDFAEALHHYTIGLENYRSLSRHTDICFALNNLGRLHMDSRRWIDAERAYGEAIEISLAIGDRHAQIAVEVNVAEMWVNRGDRNKALTVLDSAQQLSDAIGDVAWTPRIACWRGVLLRDDGRPHEADALLTSAVHAAEAREDQLLLAETLRERAELYRAQGRNRDALHDLNRSHKLFTHLRAKRELANVDRSVNRLEEDFVDLVERWGESIEAKDRYTQGHCVRVANLACAIAQARGVDQQSLFWFRIGALLHDVGKLVVPSEVLNKPGKLTADEWTLMKSHTTAGVDILAGIDFPWDVRPLIESHHERWDGGGYPHGLQGEAIPVAARILSIADVYDALTSLRSYKDALSHDVAMEIMRRDAGRAFDPDVFAAFERVIGDGSTSVAPIGPRPGTAPEDTMTTAAIESITGDTLTGLPGRASLMRIAARALEDCKTTRGSVSVVALELDAAANSSSAIRRRLLRSTARVLRRIARTSDFLARTGPHRFVMLLPETSACEAQRIRAEVDRLLARRARHVTHRVSRPYRTAVVSSAGTVDFAATLLDEIDAALAADRGDVAAVMS